VESFKGFFPSVPAPVGIQNSGSILTTLGQDLASVVVLKLSSMFCFGEETFIDIRR
jgi:hypothetical protein